MKRCIADGSVGFPHVRVGHRQDSIAKPHLRKQMGFFFGCEKTPAIACGNQHVLPLRFGLEFALSAKEATMSVTTSLGPGFMVVHGLPHEQPFLYRQDI